MILISMRVKRLPVCPRDRGAILAARRYGKSLLPRGRCALEVFLFFSTVMIGFDVDDNKPGDFVLQRERIA